MRSLRGKELADGEWKLILECVFVGGFGLVFPFFGGHQERVVSAAQLGFQIGPNALDGAARRAAFVNIVNPLLVDFTPPRIGRGSSPVTSQCGSGSR